MLRAKLTTAVLIGTAAWPAAAYALPDQPSPLVLSTTPRVEASPRQDLRSPDARDAARSVPIAAPETSTASPSRSGPSVPDGFEWADAGIGAAVMLALMSVAGGTVFLFVRRRTPGGRADGLSG